MKVGYERPDVPGVLSVAVPIDSLETANDFLIPGRPARIVALVYAVIFPGSRRRHVVVDEAELADNGVEGETVHAISRRVHHDRTRPVNHISGGNLLAPLLQAVRQVPTAITRHSTVDGKNRPDRNVHVDIGRPIQRIEKHYILPSGGVGIGRNGILFFLRRHERDTSCVAKGLLHYLIRQHVEFLLLLALYVDFPCGTQDVHQPRAAYVARYYFGG